MSLYRSGFPLAAAAAALIFVVWQLASAGPDLPNISFHGKVVDALGAPIPDADVSVSIWQVAPGWSAGKGPPLNEVTKGISLRTDEGGKFTLAREKGYILQILDVRKPGYVWLVDLAWSVPNKGHPDNRYYIYGGGFPVYVPDEARPAIFPMQQEGELVAGMPSRGGADQSADGIVTLNIPVKPVIPTTGPGAPKSGVEAGQKLHDLALSKSVTRPIRPAKGDIPE